MKYWFTADTHFNHENIITYTKRPFKNLEHMNNELIRRWNERVKKEDIIFFLGDFCFRNSSGGKKGEGLPTKAIEWEKKLNGKIIHIKGNHDKNNSCKTIIENLVIRYARKQVFLVHRPEHMNINYSIHFVGHVHNKWKFRRIHKGGKVIDLINVGVDVHNFMPVTFDEIMKEYNKWRRKI